MKTHHYGLIVGLLLASSDVVAMGIMKHISLKKYELIWMVLVNIIYFFQPWLFLNGLNFTSMTILNLSWDLFSDLLVSFSGIFIFKEPHNTRQLVAIVFALFAIYLFSTTDSGNLIN